MLIEALTPLTIRLPEGEVRLRPGEPFELSDQCALKLMECAPGRVRRVGVTTQAGSLLGQVIQWDSPLFGLLSGLVQDDYGDRVVILHPLTEQVATIPKAWVRRQHEQELTKKELTWPGNKMTSLVNVLREGTVCDGEHPEHTLKTGLR